MKKIFTLLSLLACMFVNAQEAKETMRIHSNGEVTEFAVADIDSVTFVVPDAETEWTEWEQINTCTYNLGGYWNGPHSGLPIYYREYLLNDKDAQFYIPGIANVMNMTIDYDRTTGNCAVKVQQAATNDDYGPVFVSDMPNYPLQPGLSYDKYPCTYNKETGTFNLTLVYFVSAELGSTGSGYFAAGVTETIQLDGFDMPNTEWTEWEDLGTCSYTFAGIYDGVKEGLTLSYRQSNYNDNEAEFRVPGLFGDGWDLVVKYDRITGQCSVPVQQVMKDDTYRAIYVSDMPNYPLTPGHSYDNYPCTYNAETGTITLTLVYFASVDLGSSASGYFAAGVTETIQLDGMGGNEPIASIEDFEGDWVVPGTYNGKAYECIGNISVVDIDSTEYLLCSGFADAASFGYTSDEFVMLFDAKTGRVTLPTQEAPDFTYQGQVYSVMVALSNSEESKVFNGSLVGKLVGNKIKFVNAEGNKYQADSFVHYAPDLGLISNFNQLEWTRYDASNAPAKVAHEKSVIKKGEFKVTGLVTKKNFELIKL